MDSLSYIVSQVCPNPEFTNSTMAKLQAITLLAYVLGIGATPLQSAARAAAVPCEQLTLPSLPGLQVSSLQGTTKKGYMSPLLPTLPLDICSVNISYNHQGENDITWVNIWLPLDNWNGRWQATGGGGLATGYGDLYLLGAAPFGYSTGTTEGGLTLNGTINAQSGAWALKSDNTPNESLIKNFAYRALHDMNLMGKSLTQSFYGQAPAYSYYTGCSTGGRMGYLSAQVYPDDFDGIMANAPAVNSPEISPGDYWPTVVMLNLGAPPQCVFNAYYNATLAYCDPLDGVKDGLISNLGSCNYDPNTLVGTQIPCSDTSSTVTITQAYADVVSLIWQGSTNVNGAALFPGNPRGAAFTGLANTTTTNGVTVPVPFTSAEFWIKYLVTHNPNYPTRNMTFADFDSVFESSVVQLSSVIGTMEPNLTAFQAAGNKLLTWQGLADQLITPYGTMLYRNNLSRQMALTQAQINDFYRVFFAPGVAHCGGGIGPVPTDPLDALVAWVEHKQAPATLAASVAVSPTANLTRNLCPYPQLLTYNGQGNVNDAASFSCK